ncbi:hypothetical protein GGF32_007728 [Allomyces javanicus]|nr:hypothetical protein GGF32_007728 [Allomyces javanicus]
MTWCQEPVEVDILIEEVGLVHVIIKFQPESVHNSIKMQIAGLARPGNSRPVRFVEFDTPLFKCFLKTFDAVLADKSSALCNFLGNTTRWKLSADQRSKIGVIVTSLILKAMDSILSCGPKEEAAQRAIAHRCTIEQVYGRLGHGHGSAVKEPVAMIDWAWDHIVLFAATSVLVHSMLTVTRSHEMPAVSDPNELVLSLRF